MLCCGGFSSFAAGKVLMTPSTRVGLNEKIAGDLLGRLERVLSQAGLTLKRVTQACEGERSCLVELGKKEAQDAVVVVALVMSLKSIVIDLEAVSTASGTVLGQANFKLKGPDAPLPDSVTAFARAIGEQLALEAKARDFVADAPLKAMLEPPPEPALTIPLAPSPSRTPVIISAVGAGAALVAAIILFGVGSSAQSKLPPRDSMLAPLPRDQAQQLVNDANTAYTGAAIAGGAAGAIGLAAILAGVTSK